MWEFIKTENFQTYELDLEKAEETDQIANISWVIENTRDFQKNIYFCFIDYTKAFDWLDHNKLLKILKEMGIPDHLTCLFKNFQQFIVIHIVKGFGIVNKAEVDVFSGTLFLFQW